MTYEEAVNEETTVTREEARREILKHAQTFAEFVQDCGDKAEYRAADVLAWLGY